MRFLYARFKGYIGFYNGMGLHELKIDFSKATHKICIISGKNGSGKSTLLNSLNILPDSSSDYMVGVSAEKELHILDGDNLYRILITSPVNTSGARGTTKASIQKNGEELNPNGNIGSYKDIIFSEFDLDPNYIALSKLSMSDKGLVGKSPAERKRFVSYILSVLETYNNMNKILVKKSNIFKSYLNNTSAKIKSIGDEQTLHASQFNLESRIADMNSRRKELENQIVEAETFIRIADPDGSIQDKYNQIYDQMLECNNDIKATDSILATNLSSIHVKEEDVAQLQISLTKQITSLEYDIKSEQEKLNDIIQQKEEDLHLIEIKKQKIENIKDEFDIDQLRSSEEILRKTIKRQEKIFCDSGITSFDVSRDEYIHIFSTMQRIKQMIDLFKNKDIAMIIDTCSIIKSNSRQQLEIDINSIEDSFNHIQNDIFIISKEIEYQYGQLKMMDVLNDRPNKCKIDSCPFITNAIEIRNTNPEQKIHELEKQSKELEDIFIKTKEELQYKKALLQSVKELEDIISLIRADNLLDKLPISYILRDQEEFLRRIENSNNFNEIEDCAQYIESAEEIESYRENKELLVKLEAELKISANKESLIDEMVGEVIVLQQKLDSIIEQSETLTKSVSFNKNLIADLKDKLEVVNRIIELLNRKSDLLNTKTQLSTSYHAIKTNIEQIKQYLDNLNNIKGEIERITLDMEPLKEQIKIIEHSLITLEECKNEYNMYNEKFEVVNKLKKYSSPTSEGIQTLFISSYMSKTLTLCNDLLSMLFYGEYKLLNYVINSEEFRIPFVGTGMEVDDISSGSSSQVAMMGLIINFVLLFQASTKYNIVGCDELDEVLDTYNRIQYIQVLYKIIEILNIDQCIIISHSTEIDRSNMDVIQLAEYNETDCYGDGNIIFNFYDYIS